MIDFIKDILKKETTEDKELREQLKIILGLNPKKLNIYKQALRHDSTSKLINSNGLKNNNERLEFLGDAILSAVIAEMVFVNYPFKNEGFLTQMRSKLVSREMLNQLSKKTGIFDLLQYDKKGFSHPNGIDSAGGNAMEAMIGAVYIDRGFRVAKKYIINNIINNHIDIKKIEELEDNYKSKLHEWAQSNGKKVKFEETEVINNGRFNLRKVVVLINEEIVAEATDHVKKKAEQEAAKYACEKMGLTSK
ncbi:MAG: ribonuclease III [Bacteroidetes bacterium]|nr:ribonuclease III [Bacteroidota bacterium]